MAREQALRRSKAGAWNVSPFYAIWRLLTSVRFAIFLIGLLALVSLLGVVLPQVPPNIRNDPSSVGRWLEEQEGKFGPATDFMHQVGLFEVFNAPWFTALVGVLAVAVTVCVCNRFAPIWRTIRYPQKRVPDTYFERARHRADFPTSGDGMALEAVLRRSRYHVERYPDKDAAYLFADRFAWTSLGTFVSHLAIITFIVAGVVSAFTGFESQLFIGEGNSMPVFAENRQFQVELQDAVGRFDAEGRPLDYRSHIVIFDRGTEAKRCTSTVNDPCTYAGYRFSQAAYFGFGAALQVRDVTTGNVIYKETLSLFDTLPSPQVTVRNSDGQVLLDDTLVLDQQVADVYGTLVTLYGQPGPYWFGVRPAGEDSASWELIVFEFAEGDSAARTLIASGEAAVANGLEFTFTGVASNPALLAEGVPLPSGDQGQALVQMHNAVYGSSEASSGRSLDISYVDPSQPPQLYVRGDSLQLQDLQPEESSTIGNYEYTFLGQREFAGIQVKRDRSDKLIWIATGLFLAGIGMNFYLPRRRLWAKITPERTYLAGIAGHMVNFEKEMRQIGNETTRRAKADQIKKE